ncbi:MAG: acyclic terpene utilization AtuA family protein [Gemmataceae bacterium]
MKEVRIGNGCGFWGDSVDAPARLAAEGQLDYLTLEYLAELTMSILALQKLRDPQAGYAADFIDVLPSLLPFLPTMRLITNAGGMNPHGCAEKARALLDASGLSNLPIGVVSGDDLLPSLDRYELRHLDTGEPLATVRERVVSANAYLGSGPIIEALQRGATIVITGRVADACLTVAPAAYEHQWRSTDWDCLAGGTVAGHLIECGAQVTGGLWMNSDECDLTDIGYPIASVAADGSCYISKPPGSGGAVNRETVAEQLLYEVGNPAAYLSPDVTADFTSVQLRERGPDEVSVSAARGQPAPEMLKVSIAYRNGWAAAGTLVVPGPGATAKARRCGEIVRRRLQRIDALPEVFYVEVIGSGDTLPAGTMPIADPPEVLLRIYVRDSIRAKVERFGRELAPLVTSGPPGITGYTTGRPVVREVLAYWPALVPREAITAHVEIL